MNRNDVKSYSGWFVQIALDGKEEGVTLNADDPEKAFIDVVKSIRPFEDPFGSQIFNRIT